MTLHSLSLSRSYDTDSGIGLSPMAGLLVMVIRFSFQGSYTYRLSIGVYLAKDASTSMGYFAAGRTAWKKSKTGPVNCMALTEVVNLPSKFVSSSPHYVIKDTHWIMW